MLIEAISCVNTAIKCDSTTPLIQAVWVARQTKKLPLNAEHSAVVRMLPHAKQTLPKETVMSSERLIMPQILGAQLMTSGQYAYIYALKQSLLCSVDRRLNHIPRGDSWAIQSDAPIRTIPQRPPSQAASQRVHVVSQSARSRSASTDGTILHRRWPDWTALSWSLIGLQRR